MNRGKNLADQLRAGNDDVAARLAGIIKLKRNNLVERPWGGLRMLEYKGGSPLVDQKKITGQGVGEAFEVASCPSDEESDAFPSTASLPDGSEISLPVLMSTLGEKILGPSLFREFCGEIPLLPKTLDIEELLSVQAHPPGNTELYIIIDAEPGATIRLGFASEVDPESLQDELAKGRRNQEQLLELLDADIDQHQLHCLLAPALAERDGKLDRVHRELIPQLRDRSHEQQLLPLLRQLKALYWRVLDLLNEIPVSPGQIIYNATPQRVCAGTAPSAEVHALGNPQQQEILMLEIRRPGITYRAWDNVRFPIRNIDIEKALAALNCGVTDPKEFLVTPTPSQEQPGVFSLVESRSFNVEKILVAPGQPITIDTRRFHTLHSIAGNVQLVDNHNQRIALCRGESAIVPATVSRYEITADTTSELIRVSLPDKVANA